MPNSAEFFPAHCCDLCLMETFSFHSLFVSPLRIRAMAYSTAGMGYYLLAWHTHMHMHTHTQMENKLGESAMQVGM